MLRVKKGPCAPLRLSSMLSRPATGITCMVVTTGVAERGAFIGDSRMSVMGQAATAPAGATSDLSKLTRLISPTMNR